MLHTGGARSGRAAKQMDSHMTSGEFFSCFARGMGEPSAPASLCSAATRPCGVIPTARRVAHGAPPRHCRDRHHRPRRRRRPCIGASQRCNCWPNAHCGPRRLQRQQPVVPPATLRQQHAARIGARRPRHNIVIVGRRMQDSRGVVIFGAQRVDGVPRDAPAMPAPRQPAHETPLARLRRNAHVW